jgi:hypothetical protein
LAEWVEGYLDRERVAEMAPQQPLAHWDLDALVEQVAGDVARQAFRAVGGAAMDHPDDFERAVRDRLVAVRTDSNGT